MTMGAYLRKKRIKAGYTQGAIAKKLGYKTPQFISNYERGLCDLPLAKWKKVSRMFRMDIQDLVTMSMCAHRERILKAIK